MPRLFKLSQPEPELYIEPEGWLRDLEFVGRELPRRHANAFHHTSRESFERELQRLSENADTQPPEVRFAGLLRLVNTVGDGHTSIVQPRQRHQLPVKVGKYDGEFRISEALPSCRGLLGCKVLRIGGKEVRDVFNRMREFTPADETPSLQNSIALDYLTRGLLLRGIEVTADSETATFTLAGPDATTEELLRSPARIQETDWEKPCSKPTLAELDANSSFLYRQVSEKIVYCNFRGYQHLGRHANALLKLVGDPHVERLIIDLRQNGGGDYTVGERKLIRPIQSMEKINKRGHLFVLVGPRTFSAAMNNAAQFRTMTEAILVGEQVGERPNSYQEPRQVRLPNSHLNLRYSTRWYAFSPDCPNEVNPDVCTSTSWEDYALGRDPALEHCMRC